VIAVRKAADRGRFDFGWLDTRHTFSFGEYRDERHMGFRSLRVINEDRVRPGGGFGTHGHRDMEILSYVLSGALEHKDSLGSTGVLRPGDVQRMSAGSGVRHSEYNHSGSEEVHFLQVWILPDRRGAPPRYEDRRFPLEGRTNRLQLIASPDAADGSLSLYQDARVYAAVLEAGKEISLELGKGRGAWVQVARGGLSVGHGFTEADGAAAGGMECAGEWAPLEAGDGAALEGERRIVLRADADAEALIFDLA
jgi:redox-sensitive bicupin YhaK (pirin superfamily)